MHGLPKQTREEMQMDDWKYARSVDHREFLPNSLANSAKKKLHSSTFKTQNLNLYKVRGGYGNHSALFNNKLQLKVESSANAANARHSVDKAATGMHD